MEILIGRDKDTGKLRIKADGKALLYGTKRLPDSVLEEHIKLRVEDDCIRLENLNLNAYTYVNGQAVEKKNITRQHNIELGRDRYPLDWHALDELIPAEADIRSLKPIWEEYESQNISLQIAERRFNTLRSLTGLITMAAIALSITTGGRGTWYIVLYLLAIIISLLFFIKSFIDSSKIPQKKQELGRIFQHSYTCPNCGHFLGNQSYDLLTQNDHCPYCKTKFIH